MKMRESTLRLLSTRLSRRLSEPVETPDEPPVDETPEEKKKREEEEKKKRDQGGDDPDDDRKDARTVAMAQAIVNAGRRARGEAPITLNAPPSPKGSSAHTAPFVGSHQQRENALRIVNAGRRARGEKPLKSLDDWS
jgi:hypothetical protein